MGKNYKLMGSLTVMKDGDVTDVIDSNNKLFLVRLNSKSISEDQDNEKYEKTRARLISNSSNIRDVILFPLYF